MYWHCNGSGVDMRKGILKWLREHSKKIINSIAFYPAIIAVGFVLLSWIMLQFDFSDAGKEIKAKWSWLSMQDASTARVIASTIAAGILSFTVFSFSMVMIVMNQAASQMSNRVLESLIGNRLQQVILGFYIGTIVYALLLISAIRDIDAGIYVPALSVYLLIAFTIIDIFLFIYFLHYITQSVKHTTIIHNIQREALESLGKRLVPFNREVSTEGYQHIITAPVTGYFQGFDEKQLVHFAEKEDLQLQFLFPRGSYLLKGIPMLKLNAAKPLTQDSMKTFFLSIDFYKGQSIAQNYLYGFQHLTEIGVKALSPGINDPATAIISLHALTTLLACRIQADVEKVFYDGNGVVRVISYEPSFKELLQKYLYPLWDYGKNDRSIQEALQDGLLQLIVLDNIGVHTAHLNKLLHEVKVKAGAM